MQGPNHHSASGTVARKNALQRTWNRWTVRHYHLPDKSVASQVLMYRQLLHCACKPGLVLSRPYQGTVAQQAVQDLPWWSSDVDMKTSGKMVISYDNLLARLWQWGVGKTPEKVEEQSGEAKQGADPLAAAAVPTEQEEEKKTTEVSPEKGAQSSETTSTDVASSKPLAQSPPTTASPPSSDSNNKSPGLAPPPVPHPAWVKTLGFQQEDPLTDFRSGGMLSLGVLVYFVESCPQTVARFMNPDKRKNTAFEDDDDVAVGDASVLPLGLTSINVTDMMSKFLCLAKSTDKMDALLSQKPFWNMFANPRALLACQHVALDLLADVVVELRTERLAAQAAEEARAAAAPTRTTSSHGSAPVGAKKDVVSVFDFAHILHLTEQRVEHDLLGSGPQTVEELYTRYNSLKLHYQQQLRSKLQEEYGCDAGAAFLTACGGTETVDSFSVASNNSGVNASHHHRHRSDVGSPQSPSLATAKDQVLHHASSFSAGASSLAGNVLSKFQGFDRLKQRASMTSPGDSNHTTTTTQSTSSAPEPEPTLVRMPPPPTTETTTVTFSEANTTTAPQTPDVLGESSAVTAEPTVVTLPPPATDSVEQPAKEDEVDFVNVPSATQAVSLFSIGGDDEEEEDVL